MIIEYYVKQSLKFMKMIIKIMFFKKKPYIIKIRNFEPLTASSDVVNRKMNLKEKIEKDTKNLQEIREFCQDKKLSLTVQFFLYNDKENESPQPEGRTKKILTIY